MRKAGGLGIVVLAAASLAATPSKAKVHGFDLSGTIAGLDPSRKAMVVQTVSGKQTKLVWTNATMIVGGPLAVGQKVRLRYLDKDSMHIVTSIHVSSPEKTPTAVATPLPTANPAGSS
jgi:hypothetical protein